VARRDRFTLRAFVAAPLPYRVGMIVPHEDAPVPVALLTRLATRVRQRFERVVRAARTIADDEDAIPELPDDPALLAFSVASFIDLSVADRQRLLASTSPGERLRTVDGVLGPAVDPIEQRAVIHGRAKTNGHGGVAHL